MCTSANHDCCQESARKSDAAFCLTCGDPILRCGNHSTCGGVLTADLFCPICFAPELKLLDAQEKISVGQAAHLKLELANRSPSTKNLVVKQAWFRVATGDWTSIEIPWNQVEQGTGKPLRFNTRPLETGGEQGVEILLVLAAQHGFREEVYAFSASFTVTVAEQRDVVVQQNIHYAADAPQTGATIYAPVRVHSDSSVTQTNSQLTEQLLRLHRASRYEQRFGVRSSDQPQVGPATTIEFQDNKTGRQISIPKFAQRRSQIVFGRTRSKEEGGTNDVRLLFLQPDGSVDESSSLQISREHFCLYAEQGVLKLRVLSAQGVHFNGLMVFPGDVQQVDNHAKIELRVAGSNITLLVDISGSQSEAQGILIRRV